ncbi:MAG: LicD family protein [Lachnospiraceae bacterium]|nr:LicD family protein [Lachnospiraceae bacterium]
MYFDPSYFKEEERDGFVIKPMMKRAWAAQLEVLQVIDEICKRHNIVYFATFGTLLGAVRHGGFIPWDDDIDIGMRRKDFIRFQHYARQELPEGFHLFSAYAGTNEQLIARVLNSLSITTEPSFMEKFHGCPYAVGIDIFIFDNIPLHKEEEEIQCQLVSATYALQQEWDSDSLSEEEKIESLHQIEDLCKVKFTDDQPIRQQLLLLCDRLCAMFWDIDAKEISVILCFSVAPRLRFSMNWYESIIEVPFDVTTIPIPIGYDNILTVHYGENYMIPKQSHSHTYPFFKEQQQTLFEEAQQMNIELPDYLKEVF